MSAKKPEDKLTRQGVRNLDKPRNGKKPRVGLATCPWCGGKSMFCMECGGSGVVELKP